MRRAHGKCLRTAPIAAAIALTAVAPSTAAESGEPPSVHHNLKVLPADISRDELLEAMLENLHGLGLPRRAGEGCLYCHDGSLEVPRGQWDYASDANPMKAKARTMMAMVREINEGYLGPLGDRLDPALRVTCHTCHAGRTDPSPLPDLLLRRYREGGFEALDRAYREAREAYLGAGAYDFRVGTLIGVADRIAQTGAGEDAARVHELNIEHHDDPAAHTGLIQHRMLQAFDEGGIEAMLAAYRRLKPERPAAAFTPHLLDPLGWRLFRGGEQAAGLRLFELNFEEHPETYPAHESLAYALAATGDPERGLALARSWLAKHPEHVNGRRLIDELTGKHD